MVLSKLFEQHCTQGMSNRVQSISLSSYEPSTARDPTLQSKDKRDILAVCLSHMVVIWTFVSESQWTVLSKWTLPVVRDCYMIIL